MSYQSVAASISGLVAGWMLDDASGTSLADFGSNNLPLTLQARGTLGGTAVLPESARSLTSVSTAGAATANRAVGGGTPLQIGTAVTYAGWITMGTPISTGWLGGRNNNWQLRQSGSSGVMQAVVWVGGSAKTVTGRATVAAGVKAFVAVTFDGYDILLVVNGKIEGRLTAPGSINATTDEMTVGSSSGANPFSGQLQGFAVFNRALSLGELRKLLRAGDSSHVIEQTSGGAFLDLVADASAVIAASTQNRWCGYCGGLMRSNERGVIVANDSFHPGCHAASKRTPVALSGASTAGNFATQAIHLMCEFLNATGRRTTADDVYYHDGTRFVGTSLPAATSYGALAGTGAASAILHRYLKGSRRSPWLTLIQLEMAELMNNQQTTGSYVTGSADANGFCQMEAGMMILLTRNSVDPAIWNSWRESFLRSCYFELNGTHGRTTTIPTNGTTDASYYINGNRQILVALVFYLAYKITGDSYWLTQYETELTFTVNPSPTAYGTGVGGHAAGFGLFDGAGTPIAQADIPSLNDTTGTAYLAEATSGQTPGVDWTYLQLSLDFATRLWLISGDARILKLMNAFRNKLQERLNRTTWVLDATGGTRTNNATAWVTTGEHVLVLRAGRSDITVADLASHWTAASGGLEANYRSQGMAGSIGYYRGVGLQLGNVLMAQADWPANPA